MQEKAQERIRSAQAGVLGSLCLGVVYLLLLVVNLVLEQVGWIHMLMSPVSVKGLIDLTSIVITGFLFGVTYRYIVRQDQDFQLKLGGILAFGLIRALAQMDTGLQVERITGALYLISAENLILFGIGGWLVDLGLRSARVD